MKNEAPFPAAAIERAKRMTKISKTVPITAEKTLEQIHDEVSRDSMAWLQVFQALHFLEENPLVNVSPTALDFVRVVRELARGGTMTASAEEALLPLDGLLPKGKVGERFTAGRKAGTVGTVRAWVRKYMAKNTKANAASAWDAFKCRPPKHCYVYENALGRYIETDGAPNTGYRRFVNIVRDERPK